MTGSTDAHRSLLAAARDAATACDYARAESMLLQILEADPMNLVALDFLGFVQFFQGRPEQAEIACRRALAVEPERAYSTKGLGLCVARQGRVDEGVELLGKAIALAPSWFDPRWDLAVVLADAGRLDEATEVLRAAELAIPEERARFASLRGRLEKSRLNGA